MKMTGFWRDCFLFLALHVPVIYFLHWGVMVKLCLVWWVLLLWDEMNKGTHWLTCFMHRGQLGGGSPATDSHIPISWGSSPSAVAILYLQFYPSAWLGMTGMVSLGPLFLHEVNCPGPGSEVVLSCMGLTRIGDVMKGNGVCLPVSPWEATVFLSMELLLQSSVWWLDCLLILILNVKNLCAIFFLRVFFIWLRSLEDVSQVLGCLCIH